MKILVICDDIYHHGEVIQLGLSFLTDEFVVSYATDMSDFSFDVTPLTGFDVVVIAKDNIVSKSKHEKWLTENIERKFADYVENGGGLLFLHAGTVLCRHSEILKNLAGCVFVNHPEQCVVDYNIMAEHEITLGSVSFSEKDEHYFIDFSADDAVIFLDGVSEHGSQPAGYARVNKRVCVLTPGHNLSVFENSEYQKIIRGAVKWCAKI